LAGRKPSVLWIEPFPPGNAGYHWRAYQWCNIFKDRGFVAVIKNAISEKEFESFGERRFGLFVKFMLKRLIHCFNSLRYQTVIVRREILFFNDYGNLFMEKLLLAIHPNVILDFDDDIAASKGEPREIKSWFGRLMLENGNKFNDSLRLYKRFIVASNYLKEKVLSENPSVEPESILVMPTCVDYDRHEPKIYDINKPVITFGWIGGNQNQPYLHEIIPALNSIAKDYPLELLVISGRPFKAETDYPVINRPWSLETEVEDLKSIDIGLMPLPLNDRTRGKGGFKLIQYMGMGIVSVASAITINREIIEDGENGFLVEPGVSWYDKLFEIVQKRETFPAIGKNARKSIMKNYTFKANKEKYISFLQSE
jgi:glycosyltransferase involved in cell wall biosynthesis